MYRVLFKLLLSRIDPERAHALARWLLHAVRATATGRAVVGHLVGPTDALLRTQALGLTFPSPVGVAAGLDKEADMFEDLLALGFGFVEVGTVTATPQVGNPRPRLARLSEDRALINRMGFPNPGAEAVAARLAGRAQRPAEHGQRPAEHAQRPAEHGQRPAEWAQRGVVGVNVGKSRRATLQSAAADYRACVRRLAPLADYLVLNVSSPNTPGLRELQDPDHLRALIAAVRDELKRAGREPPLLVKIDPDLDDRRIAEIVAVAIEQRLDGIVAVNTTVDRSSLTHAPPFAGGGVSGAPLKRRALEVLRLIRRLAGDKLVLVSVGGVETAEEVWERILAGATLVQVYTAFVYGGPGWPRQVNRALAREVRAAGAGSIQELVGLSGGLEGAVYRARTARA